MTGADSQSGMPAANGGSSARAVEATDVDLLVAVREAGDREALECFLARHLETALRVARRVCGSHSDADDCVQQAVVQVMAGIATFDPRRGRPRSWFLAIVANECRQCHRQHTRMRRRHRHPAAAPRPEASQREPGDTLLASEAHAAVRAAVAELPLHERLPLWMHAAEGLTFGEIATVPGRSENTVRSQARRGQHRLRDLLQRRHLGACLPLLVFPWSWASAEGVGAEAARRLGSTVDHADEEIHHPPASTASTKRLPARVVSGPLALTVTVTVVWLMISALAVPIAPQTRGVETDIRDPSRPSAPPASRWIAATDVGDRLTTIDLTYPVGTRPSAAAYPGGEAAPFVRPVALDGRSVTAISFGSKGSVVGLGLAPPTDLIVTDETASVRFSLLVRRDPAAGVADPASLPVAFGIPQRRHEVDPWPRSSIATDQDAERDARHRFAAGSWIAVEVTVSLDPGTRDLHHRLELDGRHVTTTRIGLGGDHPTARGGAMVPLLIAASATAVEVADLRVQWQGCRRAAVY